MKAKSPALVPIALLLILALVSSLIGPGSPALNRALAEPPAGTPMPSEGGAIHRDLGGGRYEAIIAVAAPGLSDSADLTAAYDTYVDSGLSGSTFCTSSELHAYHFQDEFESHLYKRPLLGFNVSSIPASSTVTAATLYLYLKSAPLGSGSVTISALRNTSSWTCPSWPGPTSTGTGGGGSAAVNTSPGYKTWNLTNTVENYWKGRNFNQGDNHGVKLVGPSTTNYSRIFHSRSGAVAPFLRVVYQMPTPTRTATRTPTRTATPTATVTRTPMVCVHPLTVRNTNDADDGRCDGAHCSLREAINCANSNPGPDTIYFDIPDTEPFFTGSVWMITPAGGLPPLLDGGTTIDGPSQTANRGNTNANGPEILVRGSSSGSASGFTINGGGCTIRGIAIGAFGGSGVLLSGSGSQGNTIASNYIGVSADGAGSYGNGRFGVEIINGAYNSSVTGNVIAANDLGGVWIGGAGSERGNVLSQNKIGTNADGSAAIANHEGVTIMHGAHDNTVGPDNLISGNDQNGIRIAGSNNNAVTGNSIGVNVGQSAAIGNGRNGVDVADCRSTVI